ncbi:multidrug ABC transporter permease/ATP-binding protein [Campylobacter sp. 9BO]|uniref:multidrug ABC transporter permease/ATP-binding protein n=1 Tax=Campylobacter sp. 9BO TaxID=3424759 RepID=UPI003D35821B
MIREILKANIAKLLLITILTIAYSWLGVATLAFINNELLSIKNFDGMVLVKFMGLLLAFFVLSVYANITLSNFGHKLVYTIRKRLVKQILDTPNAQINMIGKAKIIASLNSDIKTISFAFMSAPSLLQGSVFLFAVCAYLFYISPKLFIFVAVWISVILLINAYLMKHVHKNFKISRAKDDELQASYNDIVEGHRELSLSPERAFLTYGELDVVANEKMASMIKTDIYHSIGNNFSNIMLLGLVGLCIFLCLAYELASLETAVTMSLAILFLRGSILSMMSAIPTTLSAKVSLDKISKLEFVNFKADFKKCENLFKNWQEICLKNVDFSYAQGFGLKNINFCIKRGEIVFLIGKNGSGKSTFVNVLCGLLRPNSGEILIDSNPVTEENLREYQTNISAIFSDFYLFSQVIDENANEASKDQVDELLSLLEIDDKVKVVQAKLSTTSLSQGQRKRLSLFIALLQNPGLLVLDEWAADQDPIFKRVFYREILPLLKERGVSILAISHDDGYFDIAERIFLAKDGTIRELVGAERESASKDATSKLEES